MPRVIKRYENRKLYDLEAKQYISLRELADLVRAGDEVQVIDNATGADITAETLTKVILEDNATRPLLGAEFLHDLLRKGGQVVTAGVAQVQAGVDRLIAASVERLGLVKEVRDELERLGARLERLEGALELLQTEDTKNDERNHG